MKDGIIIQARTGSTRLHNKILLPFYGEQRIIDILIANIKQACPDKCIILATTNRPQDDVLAEVAHQAGILSFRGDEDNVLDRFIRAAEVFGVDRFIRVCSDNPFLRPETFNTFFAEHAFCPADYIAYGFADGRPTIKSHLGLYSELTTINALRRAAVSTQEKLYIEHVTIYLYTHPEKFKVRLLPLPDELEGRFDLRFTLDTMEDFTLLQELYATFYEKTDEGVALYLTPSRISSAADLENVNTYYVRLFVPNAGLNGQEVDITNTNLAFEFTYYSPYDEERIQISKGHLEDAAGTFSVSKSADNEYSLTLNLKYLGDNSLKISGNYNGAFVVYDTTIPNEYRLGADGTPVTIQSVVIDKTDADICVIYLSRQPGITTVAGMSAADAVVRLSKTMLDGVLRGFSGDDENVKISITYEGVTYSRANTTLGNLALGGRTSVSLQGNEVEMTFEVVGIKKYGDASLSGYYKGAVTVIE